MKLIFVLLSFGVVGKLVGQTEYGIYSVSDIFENAYYKPDSLIVAKKIKTKAVMVFTDSVSMQTEQVFYTRDGHATLKAVIADSGVIKIDSIHWVRTDSFQVFHYEAEGRSKTLEGVTLRPLPQNLKLAGLSAYKVFKNGIIKAYRLEEGKYVLENENMLNVYLGPPIDPNANRSNYKKEKKKGVFYESYKEALGTGAYTLVLTEKAKRYQLVRRKTYEDTTVVYEAITQTEYDSQGREVFSSVYSLNAKKYISKVWHKYPAGGGYIVEVDDLNFDGRPDDIRRYNADGSIAEITIIVYYSGMKRASKSTFHYAKGLLQKEKLLLDGKLVNTTVYKYTTF
jgi:hypothetical protein